MSYEHGRFRRRLCRRAGRGLTRQRQGGRGAPAPPFARAATEPSNAADTDLPASDAALELSLPIPEVDRSAVHELRNLLNGAKLHLTLLERELGDLGATAEARDATRIIHRDIDRIAEVLNGKQRGQRRATISLRALCTRAVQLVAGEAASAGVALASEVGFENALLDVDLTTMEQVLLGLLVSAVEAALSGSSQVLLRARRDHDAAVIEIKHDGAVWRGPAGPVQGVLSAAAAAACGLSMAFRVVAEHGGAIEVDSEAGRTTFRVRLPVRASDDGVSEERAG